MANAGEDAEAEHPHRKGVSYWSAALPGIGALLALLLAFKCIAIVQAGHVGVLTLFSRVIMDRTLPEGLHLVGPLKSVHQMSVQTQTTKEVAGVPSAEGWIIHLEAWLLFRVDPDRAAEVYQLFGDDYVENVVGPNLRAAMRAVSATFPARAFATVSREEVARKIDGELKRNLAPRGFIVERVLIRNVQIPAKALQVH